MTRLSKYVKPIAFRPTPKIQQYVDSEREQHPEKKRSEIIIELLEKAVSYSGQIREAPTSPKEIVVYIPLMIAETEEEIKKWNWKSADEMTPQELERYGFKSRV